MADQENTTNTATVYADAAIQYIRSTFGSEIERQAALLGVSKGAIAGAMVKEFNYNIGYSANVGSNGGFIINPLQTAADRYALAALTAGTILGGNQWSDLKYQDYLGKGTGFRPSVADKLDNPLLIDAGDANIRIGKAIYNLDQYFTQFPANPLGLDDDRGNVAAITGKLVANDAPFSVAMQAMEILQAQQFLQDVLTRNGRWDEFMARPQSERDAVLVTLNCNGLDTSRALALSLIPVNLRNDLLDPGLIAEGLDSVAVRDEGIPRITARVDNGVLVDPDAQREEPFAQEQPDTLDWIAFR